MSITQNLTNIEAERNLLGSILLDSEAFYAASEILTVDDFSEEKHRKLFRSISYCEEHNLPLDMVTLREALIQQGEKDPDNFIAYSLQLIESVASPDRAPLYARIIEEKSRLRKLRELAQEILTLTAKQELQSHEVLESLEKKLFEISQVKKTEIAEIGTLAKQAFQFYKEHEKKKGILGIPSGYSHLDRLTSGFQKSDLIIIAGRTSMGKTSFALNIAEHVAIKEKIPVAIFSLEMSREQLALRLLCSLARVTSTELRQGEVDYNGWKRLKDALQDLASAPLFIDDTSAITPLQLKSKARRLCREVSIGLIIVDYLQLMTPERRYENRALEISEISRSLKALARELNIPVIALSQLSRAAEKDKTPQLSHLRESGAIEQDADLVLFVHRPHFWEQLSKSNFESSSEEAQEKSREARIIVAKHRNGPTGTIELVFNEPYTHFVSKEKYLRE